MMSISSNVGISFNSSNLTTWSKQIGMQGARGLMKSLEDGPVLSYSSIVSSTSGSRMDPRLRSSRVVSFSPVYSHAGRAHYWRRAMRFDNKSCITIIDVKPFSTSDDGEMVEATRLLIKRDKFEFNV
jgi:hypothetical protein